MVVYHGNFGVSDASCSASPRSSDGRIASAAAIASSSASTFVLRLRPGADLRAVGAAARAGEVSEQPGELGGAEIGVEEEAGLVPDHGLEPHPPQPLAVRRGAGGPGRRRPRAGRALV
jgi:hypothetical protein